MEKVIIFCYLFGGDPRFGRLIYALGYIKSMRIYVFIKKEKYTVEQNKRKNYPHQCSPRYYMYQWTCLSYPT